jgi:methyltransferase family protein
MIAGGIRRARSGIDHVRRLVTSRVVQVREIEDMRAERDQLRQTIDHIRGAHEAAPQFVPPGHFYSPVPSLEDIRRATPTLYGPEQHAPAAIDLREEAQLALFRSWKPIYDEVRFPEHHEPGWRYYWRNPAYSYSDAFHLHCMLRHARPRRLIEVGSGYSSCMTLDTCARHLGDGVGCTFIEPHPELLNRLLRSGDRSRIEILDCAVQDVPLQRFRELEAGDVLFIDSTHVVRASSDVNYLFFSVLPALRRGVYVHFHDVFYPFEYPMHWLLEGRQWSELYLFRAFLMYNQAFEVVVMNTFLESRYAALVRNDFPLVHANPGGGAWLRKTRE